MSDDSEVEQHLKILSQEELRNLKSQYNKAKELLENISGLLLKYESSEASLKSRLSEVDKLSVDATEKFNAIEIVRDQASTIASEIKDTLERAQSSTTQLEEGLQKFENIKGKIEGKEGEIENLVSTANGLRVDIEKSKTDAQQRLTEINSLLVQVQEKISEVQSSFEEFAVARGKILDSDTGLNAILSQSQALQKQSQAVFAEIKSFRDQSKSYVDEIQANKEQSDSLRSEIEAHLSAVNADKAQVESVTQLITDTGFANSFQKRQAQLSTGTWTWLVVLVLALIALAVLVYKLFSGIGDVPEFRIITYRITLTSPLLFLIAFAATQYSHERKLMEKYAFKAAISTVIRSHAKFLMETASNKNGTETFAFTRGALENIYSEPDGDEVSSKKVLKEIKSLHDIEQEKKGRIKIMLEQAKELKLLIPDDATLRTVIELFAKFK